MITVTFPDGNQRSYEPGTTAMDVAKSISHGLARNILSGSYDGQTIELNDALTHDGTLQFFTWKDAKGKEAFWHSSAHVLAPISTNELASSCWYACHLTSYYSLTSFIRRKKEFIK